MKILFYGDSNQEGILLSNIGQWMEEYNLLVEKALEARKNAYVPYSEFAVGAALLGMDGVIYTGCNVENASFGATICAERTAITKAVSEGSTAYKALVVVGGPRNQAESQICTPCGICRQFIREFVDASFPVIMVKTDGSGRVLEHRIYTMDQLLVDSFGPENLKK